VIGLGDDQDLKELPAPLGLHPAGTARDERYVLTIDRAGIRLRPGTGRRRRPER
jgi:hypothetical protein